MNLSRSIVGAWLLSHVCLSFSAPPDAAAPCGGEAPSVAVARSAAAAESDGNWRRRRPAQNETTADPPSACVPDRLRAPAVELLPPPAPVEDRWRLVEGLGYTINWRNSYLGGNPLKGDRPIAGGDRFANVSATFSSLSEGRAIATPGNAAEGTAGSVPLTPTRNERFFNEGLTLDAVMYQGDTVFKPPDWQLRATTVLSYSGTEAGSTLASGGSTSVQALWFERHLRDVSAHYDFDSLRVGIQPLTSDFRGFLLSDQPLALRFFGTRDNNTVQYNLAWLRRLQKNRVRLNSVGAPLPASDALLANVYWQDFPRAGLTSEFIGAYSVNRAAGVQLMPGTEGATAFPTRVSQRLNVGYLGYGVDGHVGRLNTTTVLYGALGRQRESAFNVAPSSVRAWFAASEMSIDFDWRRVRVSLLHASGDRNPFDQRETGFDSMNATPVFAGSDSSYFVHQRWALQAGAFDLKARDALLPSLRSSADSGLQNFTNPGLNLLGVGVDLDLTPRWRVSVDVNGLWLDQPGALAAVVAPVPQSKMLGTEFAANTFWRPWNNQNVILRLSGSTLLRGDGYRNLYRGTTPYSVFAFLVFNY